eukprot:10165_6
MAPLSDAVPCNCFIRKGNIYDIYTLADGHWVVPRICKINAGCLVDSLQRITCNSVDLHSRPQLTPRTTDLPGLLTSPDPPLS